MSVHKGLAMLVSTSAALNPGSVYPTMPRHVMLPSLPVGIQCKLLNIYSSFYTERIKHTSPFSLQSHWRAKKKWKEVRDDGFMKREKLLMNPETMFLFIDLKNVYLNAQT